MEPRRDSDWLRRKLQDQSRRIEALENGRRLDPEGGTGLGRPWIPIGPVWITGSSFWGTSTSASFFKVAYVKGVVQHPYVLVQFSWRITDGATTGDYRLVQTRSNGETKVITIGSFAGPNSVGTEVPFVCACPSIFPELVTIEIQAARTAGTGGVDAHVDAVTGCGLEDNPFTVKT